MLLGPVRKSLRRHGAYLLKLPSSAVRPGALLLANGHLFQDLLEVDAIWNGVIPVVERSEARFLIDRTSFQIDAGGGLGAGVPQLGSARAVLQGSRAVEVEIRGVSLRRARATQIEHAADWLNRLNANLECGELAVAYDLMKQRRAWAVSPRSVDLVEATVHIEELIFRSDAAGAAELDVEVQAQIPIDVEAGFDVQWTRSAELVWRAGDVPIGFLPARYAWSGRKRRFVAAKV